MKNYLNSKKLFLDFLISNWPVLYLIPFTGLIFASFSNWTYDDPYITYRYANNLRNGLGFVYNSNEHVLSTTTPLFTLILSAASIFSKNIPELSILIGTVALSSSALFIWKLAILRNLPLVGATFVILFPAFPLLISTLGSEMPIYLAFCLGSFTFYAYKRYNATAVFVSLATLTRPDGILICLPMVVHYMLRVQRPFFWKPLSIFLIITLPWFIFSWIYFGSVLPVTLAAKQHQGLMEISQRFGPGSVTVFKPYLTFWNYRLEIILACIGLAIILWSGRSWIIIISWNALYFATYSLIGVTRYFWYYAPLVSGLILCVGFGISSTSLIWKMEMRKYFIWSHVLAGIMIVLLAFGQYSNLWKMRTRIDTRAHIYRAIGEWLEFNTPADGLVGTLEVGIIGYYSLRPMLDFGGLLQPDVALQLGPRTTYEDAAIWATELYKPDYLVLQKDIFPTLQKGYVKHNCKIEKSFLGVQYGHGTDINIFSCKPS